MTYLKSFKKGFTLVEMLLVLTAISVLAGIGIPVYYTIQGRNDMDMSVQTAVLSLRRAQLLSTGSSGNSVWGVYFATGTATVFRGTSYISRNTTYDEVNDIGTTTAPSGLNNITYSKVYGRPSVTGTITIRSTANETRNITINQKGTISY